MSEASPTIEICREGAREASPTLGCSIEISRDWEREESPTLGCSIEISGDMLSVCLVCQINCVGGITWTKHAHAQIQVLGCLNEEAGYKREGNSPNFHDFFALGNGFKSSSPSLEAQE